MSLLVTTPPTADTHRARRARTQLALLLLALLCCAHSLHAHPPAPSPTPQLTEAQALLYERSRSNIKLNQRVAYEAGKEYLRQHPDNLDAAYVRPVLPP